MRRSLAKEAINRALPPPVGEPMGLGGTDSTSASEGDSSSGSIASEGSMGTMMGMRGSTAEMPHAEAMTMLRLRLVSTPQDADPRVGHVRGRRLMAWVIAVPMDRPHVVRATISSTGATMLAGLLAAGLLAAGTLRGVLGPRASPMLRCTIRWGTYLGMAWVIAVPMDLPHVVRSTISSRGATMLAGLLATGTPRGLLGPRAAALTPWTIRRGAYLGL